MKISCCASASQCQLVSDCGFDRVVLSARELMHSSPQDMRVLARTLTRLSLTCRSLNDFCSGELKLCGPDYRPELVERYLSRLAPRAAELGVTQIGVGAPLSRIVPHRFPREQAREQLLESMRLAVEICRTYQIQVLMEPLCRQVTDLLNTTQETLDFVRKCEGLAMVYDIYHAWMMGEDPDAILPAMDRIEMVHIAHADHGRRPVTRGSIHFYLPYLQMLQELGYQGELAVECNEMEQISPALLKESCQVLKLAGASCNGVAI